MDNRVLKAEGRVTLIEGLLAVAVLLGLLLNSLAGPWWADPVAGYVLVSYALREVREIFSGEHRWPGPTSGTPTSGRRLLTCP